MKKNTWYRLKGCYTIPTSGSSYNSVTAFKVLSVSSKLKGFWNPVREYHIERSIAVHAYRSGVSAKTISDISFYVSDHMSYDIQLDKYEEVTNPREIKGWENKITEYVIEEKKRKETYRRLCKKDSEDLMKEILK